MMQELHTTQLNLVLMLLFILFYSLLVLFRDSKSRVADFSRNVVYMASGMLFVFYIFQISYIKDYKEFEYLVAFLIALSFRDLLPVLIDFTVDLVTTKLKRIDEKIKKS